jgi:transcription elongation GreA/GreB family factor
LIKKNKNEILQSFIRSIESELNILKKAAKDTADYATDSENKPENKYDTRGLEASYLAGAQAQRVMEMQDVLLAFRSQSLKNIHESAVVSIGSLVEVFSNERTNLLLIMHLGGGQSISYENQTIQVVTTASPLGKALIGQPVGESVTIVAGNSNKEYEIVSIF